MKKKYTLQNHTSGIVFFILCLFVTSAYGQNNFDYITVKTPQIKDKKTDTDLVGLSKEQLAQRTTYFDGLGRPIQIVGKEASPTGKDIVEPLEYDLMGRKAVVYLPYTAVTNGGQYRAGALPNGSIPGQQATFYAQSGSTIAADPSPFKRTVFEASPLSREQEKGEVGNAWQPGTMHTLRGTFRSNTAAEGIQRFGWDGTKPQVQGTFAESQLEVTETLDEHGAITIEYLNANGQPVLKKRQLTYTSVPGLANRNRSTSSPADSSLSIESQYPYYSYTYYVYDLFDNLRAVIQPEGVKELRAFSDWNAGITPAFLTKWCFIYQYDARQRLVMKLTPGGGNTYYVYNRLDQLVAHTTSKDYTEPSTTSLASNNWIVTKYDRLGRPILTARFTSTYSRQQFQDAIDAQPLTSSWYESRNGAASTTHGYTLTESFPAVGVNEVQTLIFYDDYNYPALTGSTRAFIAENGVTTSFNRLQGLVTGQAEIVLGTIKWVLTKQFYNDKLQPIQSRVENALTSTRRGPGISRTTIELDFQGRPISKLLTQTGTGHTQAVRNAYVYDHAGRQWKEVQQMDCSTTSPAPEIIVAQREFNELGQLIDKKLHSTDNGAHFLQSVDYRYNIRGWLTHINDRDLTSTLDGTDVEPDLFGMELKYNEGLQLGGLGSIPQYNGNVAEALWRTRNTNTGQIPRAYAYKYDLISRLTSADYFSSTGGSWNKATSDYSVFGVTYSDNGNILTLNRKGRISSLANAPLFGNLDQLRYTYDGNRLIGVDDLGSTTANPNASPLPHDFEDNGSKFQASGVAEYGYDTSGNLLKDDNKGITSITYNQLNLPEVITFTGSRTIRFAYTAAGEKISKTVEAPGTSSTFTQYADGFAYETNPATQEIQVVFGPMSEGRVLRNPAGSFRAWKYEYHIKDHLGNLRFAFRDNGGGDTQRSSASMEPVNAIQEEQTFHHIAETRVQDAEHARTGKYVARLNSLQGLREGPSISRTIQAGDSIFAEVYGRYAQTRGSHLLLSSGALAVGGTLVNDPTFRSGDNFQKGQARRRLPFAGISVAFLPQLFKKSKFFAATKVPVAYLRCDLYSRDSQLVATRIQRLTTMADDQWQHLSTGLKADSAGYVTVTLLNESDTDAYFDDFQLQTVDPIEVQENHYDPFGLNLVGIEWSSSQDSKFQFNGQEKQEDFGLSWNHHGARFYDPQLGRWHVVDELADVSTQVEFTPYQFSWNNPVNYLDPSGYYAFADEFNPDDPPKEDIPKGNYIAPIDALMVWGERNIWERIQTGFEGIENFLNSIGTKAEENGIDTRKVYEWTRKVSSPLQIATDTFLNAAKRGKLYNGSATKESLIIIEKKILKYNLKFYIKNASVSVTAARRIGLGLKVLSKSVGALGVLAAAADMKTNGVTTSNSLDIVMSGLMLSGVGTGIASTYFTANLISTLVTDKSIGEHIDTAVQYLNK